MPIQRCHNIFNIMAQSIMELPDPKQLKKTEAKPSAVSSTEISVWNVDRNILACYGNTHTH